uniref:Uncharacterized protein n=1 Tax=Romanomermis culicivorax TaxID=13658 RepID=A0A915JAX0_ROMCU
MNDKPKARILAISPEGLNLKALIMELMFKWADAFEVLWGQLSSLEFRIEAIALAKRIEAMNEEEEAMSNEPDVEMVPEARSEEV